MAVREAHERVRPRGWIDLNQCLELVDRLLGLARHEVAFAKGCSQIGALGRKFQPGFKKWDRILEVVLRHAYEGQKEDDVGILGSQFVRAREQIESIDRSRLIGVDLREQVKS